MFIETETTPNPATLKFMPGEIVMATGTREFTSDEEAEASPLAQALFSLGDVTGVFFGRDFVSVTIAPGSEWSDAKPQVLAVLLDHFVSGTPLFASASAGFAVPAEDDDAMGDDPADADVIDQIKDLIETRVRFKRLSEDDIQAYIGSGEWRGKAGGYAVQGIAGSFVVKMVGSYTNIVGLPLYESITLLGGEGFPIRFGWLNAS